MLCSAACVRRPLRIPAQEDLPNAVIFTEFRTKALARDRTHKLIRHLQQQATTVSGLAVCRNTTAVCHTGERLDRSL